MQCNLKTILFSFNFQLFEKVNTYFLKSTKCAKTYVNIFQKIVSSLVLELFFIDKTAKETSGGKKGI